MIAKLYHASAVNIFTVAQDIVSQNSKCIHFQYMCVIRKLKLNFY